MLAISARIELAPKDAASYIASRPKNHCTDPGRIWLSALFYRCGYQPVQCHLDNGAVGRVKPRLWRI